jgi:hypothetical protein
MKMVQAGRGSGLMAVATAMALVACGGGGGGDVAPPAAASQAFGTLQVAMTDAPSCGFDEVTVTVERVRVHQSEGAGDGDMGWRELTLAAPRKINLLDLQNGELVDLGQATLPVGQYTHMRLILAPNTGSEIANYVIPQGGSMEPVAMDTPSAQRSGIKLIHGFAVEANKTTSLVLDFDACHSVVQRGNGSYGLKPVIGIMPMTLTRIVGYVQTGVNGIQVSAQKGGVVHKATHPNASGYFVLGPIDPAKGPYDVVFTGKDLTTAVISGVPVAADQTTALNVSSDAVPMPSSLSGSVSGSVGPAAAATTGVVRALQAVGSVPAVQVAKVNTNTTTGAYSRSLPVAAPRLLVYANPLPTPLNFQAQAGSAAKYKLEASATGYTTQLGNEIAVVNGTPLTGQDFTLVVAP